MCGGTSVLRWLRCRAPEWAKRNVKVIGLSANDLKDHERWVQDINEFGTKTVGPTDVQFPIVRGPCAAWFAARS